MWDSGLWRTEWHCDSFYPSTSVLPVSIIQSMLHTHLYLNTAVSRRTSGRRVGTFWQRNAVGGALGRNVHWGLCHFIVRYCQVICFAKTESCVSNDQAVCFTVMNRPYEQSGLEGYMVQILIAFHILCIPVMQDLQYMTLRRPDVSAELVCTCWPSLACP